MIDFSDVKLGKLVIHKVGNKMRDEGFTLSKSNLELEDDVMKELLLKYFLLPFKGKTFYKFHHETDIFLNEVYTYSTKIFSDASNFYDESIKILKHLYNQSTHPNIKIGEFYMVYFQDCIIDNIKTSAIGIFKSENKDIYLKISESTDMFNIKHEKGINIKRLDKGCLIFNIDSEEGYRVNIVDNSNNEALFWKDAFLNLKILENEYHHTETYLKICSEFCDNVYAPVYNASKKDIVQLKKKAIEYFAENTSLDTQKFTTEVLEDIQCIEHFQEFKKSYEITNNIMPIEDFQISNEAVKKVKRKFKSIIKLDDNFQIKINNQVESEKKSLIEKGYDEQKGMSFYKVYFVSEE
ncbi:nucleoid-associated protein [Bacillus fungorum]|uniref:nucleoid-associated protein n=1 Tax=Bacillus fungorum TaxID=2039284 RepID=UPI003391BB31